MTGCKLSVVVVLMWRYVSKHRQTETILDKKTKLWIISLKTGLLGMVVLSLF